MEIKHVCIVLYIVRHIRSEKMASSVGEEIACFLLIFTLAAISQLISKTISAPFERVKIVEQCERKVRLLETDFRLINFCK